MDHSPLRSYGGVAGGDRQAERRDRFVEAGLEILGAAETEPILTVRGACKTAGLAARYFYESFTDRDSLATAVFEHVITGITTSTLEAVRAAPPGTHARLTAGLRAIVRLIGQDPRRGRLLFSPRISIPVLLRQRAEATRMFAGLLGAQAREFYGIGEDRLLELDTEFLVGGLAQTLASWLDGRLDLTEDEIVARCTTLFAGVAAAKH